MCKTIALSYDAIVLPSILLLRETIKGALNMQRRDYAVLLVVMAFLFGCSRSSPTANTRKPPSSFVEANLIGTWNLLDPSYSETLLITDDKTFVQTLNDHAWGTKPIVTKGTWHIEHRPSGCVYVYFEGMRYYFDIQAYVLNGHRDPTGNPISYWEGCEEQFITMPDRVIMSVGTNDQAPAKIVLDFPSSSPQTLDHFMVREK